jgi:hypothetical protein
MGRVLRALRRKLEFRKLEREEYSGKRVVGNTDGMAASSWDEVSNADGGFIPPNYVPKVDEGRPRK